MKLDKKQIPQLIILFVLVLICVGYVSFQMRGSGSRKAGKKAETALQTRVAADLPQASASVTPDLAVQSIFPSLGTTPVRRDPFAPQPLPGATQPDVAKAAEQVRKSISSRLASFGRVPKIDVRPFNPFGRTGDGARTMPSGAKQEDEPKFTLTGVVRGAQNVAIIRSRDGSGRYVVRQGQIIDGRYRVLLVAGDGVVLADGNRRIYVRLGGV